jgi:hypothetical protein
MCLQENWGVSECLSEASNSGIPTVGDGSWATGEQDFVSIGVGMSDVPAPVTSMLSLLKKPGSPTRSMYALGMWLRACLLSKSAGSIPGKLAHACS